MFYFTFENNDLIFSILDNSLNEHKYKCIYYQADDNIYICNIVVNKLNYHNFNLLKKWIVGIKSNKDKELVVKLRIYKHINN